MAIEPVEVLLANVQSVISITWWFFLLGILIAFAVIVIRFFWNLRRVGDIWIDTKTKEELIVNATINAEASKRGLTLEFHPVKFEKKAKTLPAKTRVEKIQEKFEEFDEVSKKVKK